MLAFEDSVTNCLMTSIISTLAVSGLCNVYVMHTFPHTLPGNVNDIRAACMRSVQVSPGPNLPISSCLLQPVAIVTVHVTLANPKP